MTHLGVWKPLDIGMQSNIRWAALSWPSMWTNTSAFRILSKLAWFMRLKLGIAAFLSAKPLGETKKKLSLAKQNNANQRKFYVQTQAKEKENGVTLK